MPAPYKHYAFICYSRKDSKAAAWLQKRLEWFRFPRKLVPEDRRPAHSRYVRPIYRDKTNLEVTDEHYWTNIRRALEESRYLIVLCSPDAAVSEPVNMEVAHFLATHGGDASLVAPVTLSGSVTSAGAEAALCPALRALGDALTSRNLPTMVPDAVTAEQDAWEQGFVSLVSYLLHLERRAIGDHIQRETTRQKRVLQRWLAVVIMLMAVAAWLGWSANVARRAERLRREAADKLLSRIINEHSPKLADIGRTDLIEDSIQFVDEYLHNFASDSGAYTERLRAINLRSSALLKNTQGDHAAAVTVMEAGVQRLERLVKSEPDNDLCHDDLANALETLSKTQSSLGLHKEAEASARRAVAEAQESVRLNPTIPLSKSNLAWKMKDLAKRMDVTKERAKRIQLCKDAVALEREVLKMEPDNLNFRRQVSALVDELGEEHFNAGNLSEARACHTEALAITDSLLEKTPDNNGYLDDRAASCMYLCDVEIASKNHDLALRYARQGETVLLRLVEFEPRNVVWRGRLGAAQRRMGTILYQPPKPQYRLALEAFQNCLQNWDALVSLDRTSFTFAKDKLLALCCIADCKAELGDIAGAKASSAEARKAVLPFYKKSPLDYIVAGRYAYAWMTEAQLLSRHDMPAEALGAYQEVIQIDRSLGAFYPETVLWQNNLRVHWRDIGQLHRRLQHPVESAAAFEESLTAARRASALEASPAAKQALAEVVAELAEVLALSPQSDRDRLLRATKEGLEAINQDNSDAANAIRARLEKLVPR